MPPLFMLSPLGNKPNIHAFFPLRSTARASMMVSPSNAPGQSTAPYGFATVALSSAALAGLGSLYMVTRQPPTAAKTIPAKNCQRKAPNPPAGGCILKATTAFTTGAPAKIIDITAEGGPPFPKANRTPSAPSAPTTPAIKDHLKPGPGNLRSAPDIFKRIKGANTATRK